MNPPDRSAESSPALLPLLRGVSRSFYLSIRLLPAPLRQPIAVAYLLARATDTLADTDSVPVVQRLDGLQTLVAAVEGRPGDLAALAQSFSPFQADPAEQQLLGLLTQCLGWLHMLGEADQADVRAVLRTIASGQQLDLERFPGPGELRSLATAAELRDYTWRVAGCVGEFWTQLGFRHLPHFATLPRETLLEHGRRYGQALQLVNILRDAPADLAAGRCYLPADELAAAGLTPQEAAADPSRLALVARPWLEEAQRGLDAGLDYAVALDSARVRAASALPALIGTRTLALLRAPSTQRSPVKVPRAEVRAILARLALTLAARGPLRAQYRRLSARAAMGQSAP